MKDVVTSVQGSRSNSPETSGEVSSDRVADKELAQALLHFRQSVHAWSESAMSRPRTETLVSRKFAWRRGMAWGMSCAMAVVLAGSGVYEVRHKQEQARIAAAQEAERQRVLAEQKARETEDLLARVDNDVSREVPSALQPLAQLMDDETR